MLEGNARGDDAQRGRSGDLLVRSSFVVPCGHLGQRLAQPHMGRTRIGRKHDARGKIVLEVRRTWRGNGHRAAPDDGLGMTDARGQSQENRRVPSLGDFDSTECELVGFLRVRGLQHGHRGSQRITPVVLLILTGGHPRIVGRDHYQSPVQPNGGHGEQGVRGNIQPDVLHGDNGALAGKGDANRHFQRHFLVGRPLRSSAESFEGFQYFRGGSAGIAGSERHVGVEGSHGYRLVTAQQRQRTLLHKIIQDGALLLAVLSLVYTMFRADHEHPC